MLRLFLQELQLRRNSIIGWSLGLCFFPLVYVAIYPSFDDQLANMQELLELDIYQAMGMSFGTIEDWIASTIILFLPLVAAIYGITNGTGTLAGEEADGRLEMLIVLPIPRWQIVTVKAAALAVALFIMLGFSGLVTVIVFLGIEGQVENVVMSAGDILVGLAAAYPLALAIGMMSLFFGTFFPSRRLATVAGIVVLLVSYFGSNLAGMAEVVEPFEPFFLFSYLEISGAIFIDGPEWGDALILLAIAAVSLVLAIIFFQRRDVTVGIWPWQRARAAA